MENEILRSIIDVEKDIQRSLEQARLAAEAWLEERKKEIEADCVRQEQVLIASFEEARGRLEKEAQHRAAELVKKAEHQAERLANLDNAVLVRIVTSTIGRIIPS
jgi:hypothetical protein